jgi:di/tricarboxylate transporter
MSWLRASAVATVMVGAAFVLLVVVPNEMLSRLSGLTRGQRVAAATAWFTVALVAELWWLRRMQGRRLT